MFRYPGGKSKLVKYIQPYLLERYNGSLISPFVGAGHVEVALLHKKSPKFIWLNDIDAGISSIWKAIYSYPLKLLHKIGKYEPSVNDFYDFRITLSEIGIPKGVEDITDVALMKLAIHQMSYSGLGVMAGGPIGGQSQSSRYNVGCRWNRSKLSQKIVDVNKLLQRAEVKITSWDFEEVLKDKRAVGLVYLDPPYVKKGTELYKFSFTEQDHWRLSELLYKRDRWVLSYDDEEVIRRFYSFAQVHEVPVNYSIKGARKTRELIITND